MTNYIPIFLFVAIAFAVPIVTLLVAKLVRPNTGGEGKLTPYECGVDPDSDARKRYAIRYYVVAILFVIGSALLIGHVWRGAIGVWAGAAVLAFAGAATSTFSDLWVWATVAVVYAFGSWLGYRRRGRLILKAPPVQAGVS